MGFVKTIWLRYAIEVRAEKPLYKISSMRFDRKDGHAFEEKRNAGNSVTPHPAHANNLSTPYQSNVEHAIFSS
jgi:hypothetical protein